MDMLQLLVSSTLHNLDGCVLTLQHTTKRASQNLNKKLELARKKILHEELLKNDVNHYM